MIPGFSRIKTVLTGSPNRKSWLGSQDENFKIVFHSRKQRQTYFVHFRRTRFFGTSFFSADWVTKELFSHFQQMIPLIFAVPHEHMLRNHCSRCGLHNVTHTHTHTHTLVAHTNYVASTFSHLQIKSANK